MLPPQPLHRAVRTSADTTGALLRALGLAALVVAVLLAGAWVLSDGRSAEPRAVPVQTAPVDGRDPGGGGALILPAAPARTR